MNTGNGSPRDVAFGPGDEGGGEAFATSVS